MNLTRFHVKQKSLCHQLCIQKSHSFPVLSSPLLLEKNQTSNSWSTPWDSTHRTNFRTYYFISPILRWLTYFYPSRSFSLFQSTELMARGLLLSMTLTKAYSDVGDCMRDQFAWESTRLFSTRSIHAEKSRINLEFIYIPIWNFINVLFWRKKNSLLYLLSPWWLTGIVLFPKTG